MTQDCEKSCVLLLRCFVLCGTGNQLTVYVDILDLFCFIAQIGLDDRLGSRRCDVGLKDDSILTRLLVSLTNILF